MNTITSFSDTRHSYRNPAVAAQDRINRSHLLSLLGLSLAVLLWGLPQTVQAQVHENVDEERIDEMFSEWDREGSPGCAVGVYHDDELIFSNGYGEKNLDYGKSITPETVFYIGSVSKQFAAAALAHLAVQGELDLDKTVRHYVPEMPEHDVEPTVRQLIHHTSGIPDLYSLLSLYGYDVADVIPFSEMVEVVTRHSHLNFEPGSEYLYSNAGYTLMAEIVDRVSGQTLRQYTDEHLFEPLGMDNTHFHDDRTHVVENRAISYQPGGSEEFRVSYLQNFEGVGPGGLYSTVEDMLQWERQLNDNRLDGAEGFNELMRTPGVLTDGDTLDYAFGISKGQYKGQKTVGHGGSFMGFRADYLRLPEQDYGASILCNLGSINPGGLNREVADVFLEDVFADWLERFEGTYYSEDMDLEFRLEIDEGDLKLVNREESPSGTLSYSGESSFRTGGWQLDFEVGETQAEGFTLNTGRARNIAFERSD